MMVLALLVGVLVVGGLPLVLVGGFVREFDMEVSRLEAVTGFLPAAEVEEDLLGVAAGGEIADCGWAKGGLDSTK